MRSFLAQVRQRHLLLGQRHTVFLLRRPSSTSSVSNSNHDCFPRVGISYEQGRRAEMQDRLFYFDPTKLPDWSAPLFVGVLDGHGGTEVASIAAECIPTSLREMLGTQSTLPCDDAACHALMSKLFLTAEREICAAGSSGIRQIKYDALSEGRTGLHGSNFALQGTTATVAVIEHDKITVSWVGDSHAVLCRRALTSEGVSSGGGFESVPMTAVHRPECRPDEQHRIEESGGRVQRALVQRADGEPVHALLVVRVAVLFVTIVEVGPLRVRRPDGIGGLAMTRALGDFALKLPFEGAAACAACSADFVLAAPETTVLRRQKGEDCCLIIASDGLWDTLDDDEACKIALQELNRPVAAVAENSDNGDDGQGATEPQISTGSHLSSWFDELIGDGDDDDVDDSSSGAQRASELLVEQALQRGATDNVSVVVVDLVAEVGG